MTGPFERFWYNFFKKISLKSANFSRNCSRSLRVVGLGSMVRPRGKISRTQPKWSAALIRQIVQLVRSSNRLAHGSRYTYRTMMVRALDDGEVTSGDVGVCADEGGGGVDEGGVVSIKEEVH